MFRVLPCDVLGTIVVNQYEQASITSENLLFY